MGNETLENEVKDQSSNFDRVVQLISECVVIKAQLQQYMDELELERQKNRSVGKKALELQSILASATKSGHYVPVIKQVEVLCQGVKTVHLDSVVVSMEETVSRFSKVMGDLQHHLVKMNLGSSAVSIAQVLLVKVAGQVYAFPIEVVAEIFKVKKQDIYSVDGNDTVSLRGHALSVVDVAQVLAMPGAERKELAEQKVVVITSGDVQLGVMVDELLGEESVVFKELPVQARGIQGLGGVSILGDGKIGLIIDCARLINMAADKK